MGYKNMSYRPFMHMTKLWRQLLKVSRSDGKPGRTWSMKWDEHGKYTEQAS